MYSGFMKKYDIRGICFKIRTSSGSGDHYEFKQKTEEDKRYFDWWEKERLVRIKCECQPKSGPLC